MQSKILIPTSLSEIRLTQYQELMKLQSDEDSNDIAAKKMISMLCKIRMSEVNNFSAGDVFTLMAKLGDLFKQEPDFEPTFFIDKYEFGFIPDLENMTFGEYVDAEKYLQDWDTMHKAMAVLFRPIKKKKGEKYEIEPYHTSATYAEVMKMMPLNIALGASFFLRNLSVALLNATMDFLQTELKTMDLTTAQKATLPIDGDGMLQFIRSAKATLDEWTMLPHYRCINALLT